MPRSILIPNRRCKTGSISMIRRPDVLARRIAPQIQIAAARPRRLRHDLHLPQRRTHVENTLIAQRIRIDDQRPPVHPCRAQLLQRTAKPGEMKILSWEELEIVAAELQPVYRAIPIFAAETGLRPEEWIALERRDVDREHRIVSVQRVRANGALSEYPKTDRSRRRVPLRSRVLDALDAAPSRIDSPLLFPAPRGGHLDLHNFRQRHWRAAIPAGGLEYRRPYDLRHTYATFSIAAGVSLFALARRMGTSLQMIDKTYGHLEA